VHQIKSLEVSHLSLMYCHSGFVSDAIRKERLLKMKVDSSTVTKTLFMSDSNPNS